MNKLKLISVTVLCALALSACVDDKESASVTALREAKTSYLKAQAAYQTAQAEVAKINAEVAKAKAEAEVAIARLQAEAEAAKTEAEAAVLKQKAEEAEKRFELQLAELEAQAKAQAAMYDKQYQEYLNELAKAQRDAEINRNNDLKYAVNDMKVVLDSIRIEENNRDDNQFLAAQLTQKKTQIIAGKVYIAKNDSIEEAGKLAANEATLLRYQTVFAADAATLKTEIEAIRAGLTEKANAVEKAQLAYNAAKKDVKDLETEMDAVPSKISEGYYEYYNQYNTFLRSEATKVGDVVVDAWEKLNRAVFFKYQKSLFYSGVYSSELKGNCTEVVYLGNGEIRCFFKNIDFSYLPHITYYKWEADKLLKDLKADLEVVKASLTETDTIAEAEKTLEKYLADYETKKTAYQTADKKRDAAEQVLINDEIYFNYYMTVEDAKAAVETQKEVEKTAKEAYDNAAAADKKAAKEAYDKAVSDRKDAENVLAFVNAREAADEAYNEMYNAENVYTQKRSEIENLKEDVADLKASVEANEAYITDVTNAITICFDATKKAEIDAVVTELDELALKMDELTKKRTELDNALQLVKADYNADKNIVASWDAYTQTSDETAGKQFLASLERNINDVKKAIEKNKANLNNLTEMLKDPNGQAFVQKYCKAIDSRIKDAEENIAKAETRLQALQTRKDSLQTVIDACMSAE